MIKLEQTTEKHIFIGHLVLWNFPIEFGTWWNLKLHRPAFLIKLLAWHIRLGTIHTVYIFPYCVYGCLDHLNKYEFQYVSTGHCVILQVLESYVLDLKYSKG